MNHTTRRAFLKTSLAAGASLAVAKRSWSADSSRVIGANDAVRIAVIGMGDTAAVGGVGGRGHQLLESLRKVSGARVVALCDVESSFLEREARVFKDAGETVTLHKDLRRVFDDKSIDAVVVALPNHWHGLATVWACQAGKDVYVEKPFSHNLWEGRQMVAAARKYNRIVQTGTQNRSSPLLRQVFDELRGGALGRIRFAHALMYRGREGIGRVEAPPPVSPTLDYDLWCGPAPKGPLRRKQVHYEWHWFWDTGNGEIGNNGVHMMDVCRWALGSSQPPPRAMSIGGRFAVNDAGETANTQIAFFDYHPAPMICEVRNIRKGTNAASIGTFRNRNRGVMIDCENGYFAGESTGGALFDNQGKKIKDITNDGSGGRLEVSHLANFVAAVRSRKSAELACEAWEGHCSAAACHLANISHRIGQQASPEAIRERAKADGELADAFDRCREYLRDNGVDLGATPAVLGPWVTYDAKQERFTGNFASEANSLLQRKYREPFVVPKIA